MPVFMPVIQQLEHMVVMRLRSNRQLEARLMLSGVQARTYAIRSVQFRVLGCRLNGRCPSLSCDGRHLHNGPGTNQKFFLQASPSKEQLRSDFFLV
jgi:hypothetical protein